MLLFRTTLDRSVPGARGAQHTTNMAAALSKLPLRTISTISSFLWLLPVGALKVGRFGWNNFKNMFSVKFCVWKRENDETSAGADGEDSQLWSRQKYLIRLNISDRWVRGEEGRNLLSRWLKWRGTVGKRRGRRCCLQGRAWNLSRYSSA